jgi:hypothetical protein
MHESITLTLTGNKTSLSADYFPSINTNKKSEIALLRLQTYNTFPNINETNNRMRIIVGDEKRNVNIEINSGCYEIEDIKNIILKKLTLHKGLDLIQYGIEFDMWVNEHDFRCHIKCNKKIDFNVENSLASVLGFNKKYYFSQHGKIHRSERAVNINHINSIKVMCDIAQGSFSNSNPSHSIYEFFPSGRTGTKVVEVPANLIYYKLNTSNIRSINISLVDQDHKLVHNFREKLTVVLHIKNCES